MANIPGTNGPETLIGGPDADIIDAMGGDDVLTGGGGADTLTGGTGADIFRDQASGLAGDRITDFSPGDRIQFIDLTVATGNIHIAGTTIVFNGGSIQIDGLSAGRYAIRDTANGAEVRFQTNAHNDFDGDGISDILWRNDGGYLTQWRGQANGSFVSNQANAGTGIADNSWHVAGTGDFNGDGRVDVLWRNDNGQLSNWLGTANGALAPNNASITSSADNSWHVVGTGDFNGDGKDDILWRNTGGYLTEWLGTANGSFVSNQANAGTGLADNSWHVVGTGDFNGDGIADILWRNDGGFLTDWLGTSTGGFSPNISNFASGIADNSWQVVGMGDFNGDAMSDILWRNTGGYVTEWLGTANGSFVSNQANAGSSLADNSWHVVSVGDFDGDLRDDILWRNDGGYLTEWRGTATGAFVSNQANAGTSAADTTWHVQDPLF